MPSKLAGWLATLVFVPVTGAAIGMGAWKGAILYMLVAFICAPFDSRFLSRARFDVRGAERVAFGVMLAIVATVMSGAETARADNGDQQGHRSQSSSTGFLSRVGNGVLAGVGLSTGAGNMGTGNGDRDAVGRSRAALKTVKGCDNAHRMAAGAIRRISRGGMGYDVRQAAEAASAACEQSWVALNGPELLDAFGKQDRAHRDEEAERLRACSEGYFGRWQVNDDLVFSLGSGLPARDVQKIAQMNSAADASMATCSSFLNGLKQRVAAARGRGRR